MNSDTISLENVNVEDVKKILETDFGIIFIKDKPTQFLGINLEILDLTEEYKYADKFLEDKGINEEQNYNINIDLKSFNIIIDFATQSFRPSNPFKISIVDQIAKHISLKLKVRSFISLNDNQIPFCVYENGKKTNNYLEHYKKYFDSMPWIPCELRQ